MRLVDFKKGSTFRCGLKTWLCTDVGTRIAVAICLGPPCGANGYLRDLTDEQQREMWKSDDGEPAADPSWVNGPPYAVAEHVFDEHDIVACEEIVTR